MKLCDFINNALHRSTDLVDMIRIIDYKHGTTFDFYAEIEEYGFLISEIDNVTMSARMPFYHQYNIVMSYCIDKNLNIIVEVD
jgi:hypothetical protein